MWLEVPCPATAGEGQGEGGRGRTDWEEGVVVGWGGIQGWG